MFVISFHNIRLVILALLVLLGLACSSGELIVTLTPTPREDIIELTMTTMPPVVYPTLSPSITPTSLPDMICGTEPVNIACKATVCVVRKAPHSGQVNVAYTVPNNTVLIATVCNCASCAALEQKWFFLGQTGKDQFWAIDMNQVWEVISENGE